MVQYATEDELREAVKKLNGDEVEGLIKQLSVSHTMFKISCLIVRRGIC